MVVKRRSFNRPLGERRYKKLFVIAVEGRKTEPQYFAILNRLVSDSCIKLLRVAHSAPLELLQEMKRYLKKEPLLPSDAAWLVVDKDEWTDQQLQQLFEWSKVSSSYGLALSNPNFEYWILLHFADGNDVSNKHDCLIRLKKYLPNYEKNIDSQKIDLNMINSAIKRAKQRDRPPCSDWPRVAGKTTVYRLVESILMGFV